MNISNIEIRQKPGPQTAPTTESDIARLQGELAAAIHQRELDQQTELERQQAAEIEAREQAEREQAAERERQRRIELVDRTTAQPLPSGVPTLLKLNRLDIDARWLSELFPLVMVAQGRLQLPVVSVLGAAITLDSGPVLEVHEAVSQLVLAKRVEIYAHIYAEVARSRFQELVKAELTRAPEGTILYTAALPSVRICPDETMPELARVKAIWGDCFVYKLPSTD